MSLGISYPNRSDNSICSGKFILVNLLPDIFANAYIKLVLPTPGSDSINIFLLFPLVIHAAILKALYYVVGEFKQ